MNAGAMTYVPADELYQGRMPPRDLYFNAFTQDNDRYGDAPMFCSVCAAQYPLE